MLISYRRPTDIVWSLAGATWLGDDAGEALTNGRPAAASRIALAGSSATLRGSWGTAIVPRVVALLGLTLPVGAIIAVAFRRAADAGYTYAPGAPSQPVTQLPDGSRCAWLALPAGLDPVIGVEFAISGAQAGPVDIGEAWIGPTVEIAHEAGWARGREDATTLRRSKGGQLFGQSATSWRTLKLNFSAADIADVSGSALLDGNADWEQVEAALQGGQRCCVIPRWRGQSADYLQRTALFAAATQQGDVQHLSGNLFTRSYTFEELPAAAA